MSKIIKNEKIYANIELRNGSDAALYQRNLLSESQIHRIEVSMCINSNVTMLMINENICKALNLSIIDHRFVQFSDKKRLKLPVTSPIDIHFADRFCTSNAIVLPEDETPLLGKTQLLEMDLWVNPKLRILIPLHSEQIIKLPSVR